MLYFNTQQQIAGLMVVVLFAFGAECRVLQFVGSEITFAKNLLSKENRFGEWLFIYPGTKWCGMGNIADDYDDLGPLRNTDKCCRQHDNCPDTIEKFEHSEMYNLTNDRFFTSLSCECDQEFYQCLKTINTPDSNMIGYFYFNIIGQECFKQETRVLRCLKHSYHPKKRCVKYELANDSEKFYQWFDVPIY